MPVPKLYKATVTATVYFVSDAVEHHEVLLAADKYLKKQIRDSGPGEFPTVTRVTGPEPIEGGLEGSDYVQGSEGTRGGLLTIDEAMQRERQRREASAFVASVRL